MRGERRGRLYPRPKEMLGGVYSKKKKLPHAVWDSLCYTQRLSHWLTLSKSLFLFFLSCPFWADSGEWRRLQLLSWDAVHQLNGERDTHRYAHILPRTWGMSWENWQQQRGKSCFLLLICKPFCHLDFPLFSTSTLLYFVLSHIAINPLSLNRY